MKTSKTDYRINKAVRATEAENRTLPAVVSLISPDVAADENRSLDDLIKKKSSEDKRIGIKISIVCRSLYGSLNEFLIVSKSFERWIDGKKIVCKQINRY